MNKLDFLGIDIVNTDVAGFVEFVLEQARVRTPTSITYVNAHCINMSFKDEEYRRILGKADAVYADGQAIVWAARMLGTPLPERINAGDFLIDFLRRCAGEDFKVFLLGSYEDVADKIAQRLQEKVPELQIAGVHHGFLQDSEGDEIVRIINDSGADILLVGMGIPRQEKWVAVNREKLEAPVVWCVGALFEYFSGYRARAPRWMRRCGLEWLFRLVLEPRRLWHRYLVGNTAFILRVLRYKFRKS